MFVCLDLETTGLNPKDDQIIEVAIVLFDHEKIHDEWSSLVKPPIPIPAFTTHLTGINNETVSAAPSLKEITEQIKEKLGQHPVMGHFIQFDLGFLNAKGFNLNNALLDTCQLAQSLMAKEASYSLEVLCQKLGITQVSAHRALDDVKANIELFWRLCSHIRALSQKEKLAIRPILEKSDWAWAIHILPILEETGGERLPETEMVNSSKHNESHANLSQISERLKTPFLLEERSHTDLDLLEYALAQDGQSLLVLDDPEHLPPNKEAGLLKHPSSYLDENRLDIFTAKERLSGIETMIAMKMGLWLMETETGEKSEVRFIKEEKEVWFNLCCQEGEPSSFFAKAKAQSEKSKVMLISQHYFLKDRSRKEPQLKIPKHVIVGQTEQLALEMDSAWHIRLNELRFIQDLERLKLENPDLTQSIDSLASKISILFGFLGMMLKSQGIGNEAHQTFIIEMHHYSTAEWNKVKGSAESIEGFISELSDKCKATATFEEFSRYILYLSKILQIGSSLLWLSVNKELQITVHSFPKNTDEIFSERIWKGVERLHLFTHHGNLKDDFKFLKQELSLPKEITMQSAKDALALPLYFPEKPLKNPNDPQNIEEVVNELKKWLPDTNGNVMIIANSMATAEQFFYKASKLTKELGLKLFVQNMGGGMGKIMKMSEKTAGKNVFVGNENFMNFLLEENIPLRMLAVHRLPFASPEDPIQKARCSNLQDPYKEFTLPQTALKYETLLSHFLGNEWHEKKILILDPRVHDYPGYFS